MAKSRWLNDESQLQQLVCGELDDRLSELAAQIRLVDGGFELLRFLVSDANTLRTVDDIAYRLHQATPAVENSVRSMVKLNLVRHLEAGGMTWFGITTDPDRRRLVHDLCGWQDRWRARIAQIDRVVYGKSGLVPDGMVPTNSRLTQISR